MHLLIVKRGALGDVVRTSYFAGALRSKWKDKLRLSWLTAPASVPLLRFHPAIDDIWTSFNEARPFLFDRIYSLDDEVDTLQAVAALDGQRIIGAKLNGDGRPAYSDDTAEWFDMGLLSRHGKKRADELKKLNMQGHAEIHARIFEVDRAIPEFHGDPALVTAAEDWIGERKPIIGINPFAGGRWPSKELPAAELRNLVRALLAGGRGLDRSGQVILIGAGDDRRRNLELAAEVGDDRLRVADTDASLLLLAAIINRLDLMISSDSLAMHLAIAQGVRTIAFFAPTSAAEIDEFGCVRKLKSAAADYCSYKADADNSSITADRLLALLPDALNE